MEILIERKYENLYNTICKNWQEYTKLELEFAEYSKMWLADVNNYGCITTKGKIKNKGRFEVDKIVGSEPAYHKDNSFKIIPIAIQDFFTKNIPIEQTIKNHINIFDFCGRQKFTKDSYGEIVELDSFQEEKDGLLHIKQQKITRYYVSNNGSTFVKKYSKGSNELIEKGYQVTIFNKKIDKKMEEYDINYNYYIKKAKKEIESIIKPQLSLF